MAKRKKRTPKNVVLATVLTLVLLAALSVGLAIIVKQQQTERAAAAAGVQNYSSEIPRNTYGLDGFSKENGRVIYEDETRRTIAGIDISSHQGSVDWQAVAADGISFAIIQAGYRGYSDGDLGEDEFFAQNLAGARQAGLDTGVYFFSQAVSAEEARQEAEFVLQLLAGTELQLPIFYDWERVDGAQARTDEVAGETVTACAAAFCEAVERGGYEAGVYFNQNYIYTLVDLSQLLSYPLWMAQYQDVPDFFYDFSFWQYTDSGTVAGITGPVDLNIRFVSKETA